MKDLLVTVDQNSFKKLSCQSPFETFQTANTSLEALSAGSFSDVYKILGEVKKHI